MVMNVLWRLQKSKAVILMVSKDEIIAREF